MGINVRGSQSSLSLGATRTEPWTRFGKPMLRLVEQTPSDLGGECSMGPSECRRQFNDGLVFVA